MTVMPLQDRRAGVLETPLGKDVLAVVRFDGSEGMNELFEWRIEALSADGDIDFDALIGRNATLTIHGVNGVARKFDGIVTETQWLGVREHFHAYRLVLRPWLWVLSHRTDSFIFHDMPVTGIIASVFARHGALADYEDRTEGPFAPIEYCVQYRESDMAFVMRLMEEFGINYSFVHSDGAHKLVLTDANTQADPVEGGSRRYIALAGQDRRVEECLHHVIPERRFASGKATFRDYNFKTPSAQMQAGKEGAAGYEQAGKELYDWPGRYDALGQGETFARLRLEAEEAQDRRVLAAGNSVTLAPGFLMGLTEHPFEAYNIEYLVLRCQHSFVSQQYRSGAGSAGEDSYEGQVELIDAAAPLRPLKVTPKPLVNGPQTAFVVGADGEEIDCDEYGRILVRFHWDRENDQSMRCRVAQNWAYKQWGGMIIPRIGMEVMVEFLDGDPDRPLVTGSVYNGENMPPYDLPANKTRSTFRTNTHKSKSRNHFNEIRFEDKAGNEEIFVHAEKDMYTSIEDSSVNIIGNNEFNIVENSQSNVVRIRKEEQIGVANIVNVGMIDIKTVSPMATGLSLLFNPSKKDSSWGEFDLISMLNDLKTGTGSLNDIYEAYSSVTNVQGSFVVNAQSDQRYNTAGNWTVDVKGNEQVEVGQSSSIVVDGTRSVSAGENLEYYAGQSVIIACGSSSIEMSEAGEIVITAKNIKLKADRIDLN